MPISRCDCSLAALYCSMSAFLLCSSPCIWARKLSKFVSDFSVVSRSAAKPASALFFSAISSPRREVERSSSLWPLRLFSACARSSPASFSCESASASFSSAVRFTSPRRRAMVSRSVSKLSSRSRSDESNKS